MLRRAPLCWQDVVYYQLHARDLVGLGRSLGSVAFVEARARQGLASIEVLMHEYNEARSVLSDASYASLREGLDAGAGSREAVLEWLGQYIVFVGKSLNVLLRSPEAAFQMAVNQGENTAPGRSAVELLLHHLFALTPEYSAVEEFKAAAAAAHFALDDIVPKSSASLVPRWWLQYCNTDLRDRTIASYGPLDLEGLVVSVHPFKSEYAVGSLGGLIQYCSSRTGRVQRELTQDGHDAQITALLFSHGTSPLCSMCVCVCVCVCVCGCVCVAVAVRDAHWW